MDQSNIVDVFDCQCGAVTISFDTGAYNSMRPESAKELFPEAVSNHRVFNCDYCVNHYGIDLCKCGSGQSLKDCNEKFPECGQPSQELGVRRAFTGWQ